MSAPSAEQIQGWYQKYLGRAANPDDPDKWLNGTYTGDTSGIESQIATSGEAQEYGSRAGVSTQPAPAAPAPTATAPTRRTAAAAPVVQDSPAPYQPPATAPSAPATPAAPVAGPTNPNKAQVASAYQVYLNRPMSDAEYETFWANTPVSQALQQIANSGEAQSYRKVSGTAVPAAAFGEVPGFVLSKLSDPTYSSAKYTPSAQVFSRALAATGADPVSSRGNLGSVIAFAQANGFPGAHQVGDDSIDFGDGHGPVDVLTANNTWWFNNQPSPGGGAESGGGAKTTSTGGGGFDFSSLLSHLGMLGNLGSAYGGPGSPGVFNTDYIQQIGQDPLSHAITGALAQLLGTASGRLNSTPQDRAMAIEKARMPYEIARKTQLNNARGDLAGRGLLSEQSPGLGLEADALQRIETGLAPSYTAAINNGMQELDANEQNWANILGNTAQAGTNRQTALGQLALQELAQNTQFNEFLATYGLDRDKAMYEIQQGQNNQVLQAFQLWLQYGQLTANGFI